MSTPAEILREIHRLRRYAKDLQTKLDEIPRRLKILQDRVAYQEEQLQKTRDAITHLKVQAKEDEVTLKATAGQVEKYTGQLNTILSKKEFDALQHEIAHAKEKIDHLEDQMLQTYEEIENRTAQIPEQEAGIAKAKEELASYKSDSEKRTAEFTQELEKTNRQLAEVETSLPEGDLRVQYERLIRQRGEDAFSPVKGGTCMACYTSVTAQQSNELMQGKFVLCKSCGRVIYPGD